MTPDTEPCDELVLYLDRLIGGSAWADTGQEAVKHIATVLGWRPPARILTDAADLDSLPIMSVVLAYGVAHQAIPGLGSVRLAWVKPTGQSAQSSAELLAATRGKGVTVLYEPEEAEA